MSSLVVGLAMPVVPGCCWGQSLDKTGTTGVVTDSIATDRLKKQEPALAGSFTAEREGFDWGLRRKIWYGRRL